MTIKEFVHGVLCVPVTRVGGPFIVEAIEIVLDTKDYKFYQKLSEIHRTSARYLEKALRDAKNLGLSYMDPAEVNRIFGKTSVPTTEYIVKAAEEYRKTYENEKA